MRWFIILFFYTLGWVIITPSLFPNLHLLFFAPFLTFCYYRQEKINCLWLALLCGLIIDLLSAQTRLGIYALNYCLTTAILYPQKDLFFEDNLTTLPLMTYLFSLTSTFIQVGLLYALGQGFYFSWEWITKDLIWLPLWDALYAGILFTFPLIFFPRTHKKSPLLFSPRGIYS